VFPGICLGRNIHVTNNKELSLTVSHVSAEYCNILEQKNMEGRRKKEKRKER
jgi:hypothetical protein